MFDPMDDGHDVDRVCRQTVGNMPFIRPSLRAPLQWLVSALVVQGIPAFRLHLQDGHLLTRANARVARLRERLRQCEDIDIIIDSGSPISMPTS